MPGRSRYSESEYFGRGGSALRRAPSGPFPTLDSPLSLPHTHQPYYIPRLWNFMVVNRTSFISPRISSLGTEDIMA